jgi:hypothetical protein
MIRCVGTFLVIAIRSERELFRSGRHGRAFPRATLAQVVAQFLQESFQIVLGQKRGVDRTAKSVLA